MNARRILILGAAFAMSACVTASAHEEYDVAAKNKAMVIEFYNMIFQQHKVREALAKYVGDRYIQHNPLAPNGTEALINFMEPYFAKNPTARSEIKRAVAEGDLVWLHVHAKSSETDRGLAVVDIFRVENGKVVEHWDVVQPVPEKSANENTMF
ncbi:MAG TPA: nuclear transport factor 2 family protein [Steroidobacteraceae bacterium]|nr:nuclear transport factor 2 family protein [Steroidobacteraceae bacterium]